VVLVESLVNIKILAIDGCCGHLPTGILTWNFAQTLLTFDIYIYSSSDFHGYLRELKIWPIWVVPPPLLLTSSTFSQYIWQQATELLSIVLQANHSTRTIKPNTRLRIWQLCILVFHPTRSIVWDGEWSFEYFMQGRWERNIQMSLLTLRGWWLGTGLRRAIVICELIPSSTR
jgi:hypothetical protein